MEEPSEQPSSPLDFDWDAIDAELDGEEETSRIRPDSSPQVTLDSAAQDPAGVSRNQQQTDASEVIAGYCSDEERPGANRAGSMSIFKDVVKDTIDQAVLNRQRVTSSDPAKKSSIDVEKYSRLRIKDRTVSSTQIDSTLSDLRFVRLLTIKSAMTCDKFTGSWATVGVVVEKGVPKISTKGKNFVVWKLGTLEKTSLSLLLFGAAYTEHWKEPLGAIVAVFNANVRPDGKSKEPSLSVFRKDQVMTLGTSVDYSICSGRRKDGTPCTIVLNRQLQGQLCHYHTSAARQECRTTRPELSGGKLTLVGPGIRRGYPTKPVRSPTKDEVFKGSLKRITTTELQDLLSDSEKMTTKSHSQGKRFLEVMAERTSGVKEIANNVVKRKKTQEKPNNRTPLAEKQVNLKSPGLKHNPQLPPSDKKSKSTGVLMEIDTLDDMNDSMIHAMSNFKG